MKMGNAGELNKRTRLLLSAGALLAMFAVSGVANAAYADWQKVRVLGFSTSPSGVAFQIPTGGWLDKDDFAVRVIREVNRPAILQLVTAKTDACRMAVPYGKVIRFTFDEIGIRVGESFVVVNNCGVVNRAGFAEENFDLPQE
jgi:hypothetical protein